MRRSRILLADDHVLLMDAFRKLLEPEFEVIGAVSDGKTLVSLAAQLVPDLIVIDLGLPLLNGMDAGRQVKFLLPKTRLLVVTMNEEVRIAIKALREWASGFILKKCAGTELLCAIRSVLAGKTYVTARVAHQIEREFIRDPSIQCNKALSPRQRQVLQLLAEGLTMKEAADTLSVTARTVAFHKYSIMQEFNLRSNLDLLKLAIREQLVVSA
jgi:DNA-binding NarL/FixJ family response regulator